MKTTADCRHFLAEFFTATPSMLPPLYGGKEGEMAQAYAMVAKHWKRTAKCKPLSENSAIHGKETDIFVRGGMYPKGPDYYKGVPFPTQNIAVERHFTLKEDVLGTGVMFIVIEDTVGGLHLGEYIGD